MDHATLRLIEGLTQRILEMEREHSELKRRFGNLFRIGTVTKDGVDGKAATVRLEYGKDDEGKPRKGPPLPWMEQGGAFKSWFPPSEGQTMVSFHPTGDPAQGFVLNGSFSDKNKQPSESTKENKQTFGKFSHTLTEDGLSLSFDGKTSWTFGKDGIVQKVDGVEVKHTASGLATKGGKLTHDDLNVGGSHTHKGVQTGGGFSGPPIA